MADQPNPTDSAPPPMVFKILRRPQSTGNLEKTAVVVDPSPPVPVEETTMSQLSEDVKSLATGSSMTNGVKKSSVVSLKPLEEREKAYAEARQRIFGELGSFEEAFTEESLTEDVPAPLEPSAESTPERKESLEVGGNTPGILKIAKKDTIAAEEKTAVKSELDPSSSVSSKDGKQKEKKASGVGKKSRNKKKGQQQYRPLQQHPLQTSSAPRPPFRGPSKSNVTAGMVDFSKPPPILPPQMVRPPPPGPYQGPPRPPVQYARMSTPNRWSTGGQSDIPYGLVFIKFLRLG